MTATEDLIDSLVYHQHDVEEFKKNVVLLLIALLNRNDKILRSIIISRDFSEMSKVDITRMIQKYKSAVYKNFKDIKNEIGEMAEDFLHAEAAILPKIFEEALNKRSNSKIKIKTPTIRETFRAQKGKSEHNVILFAGRSLSDHIDQLASSDYNRAASAIRTAWADKESESVAAQRIIGTKASNYKNGTRRKTRSELDAVSDTIIQAALIVAIDSLILKNNQLFRGVQWVSVLDTRTSAVCRSRSGNIYPASNGPRPPAHYRCRSITVPVYKKFSDLSLVRDISDKDKSYFTSKTPDTMTYSEWLKKQSIEKQERVLGKDRAKLFRDGGLPDPIKKFYSEIFQRKLSLAELKRKYPSAFDAADL